MLSRPKKGSNTKHSTHRWRLIICNYPRSIAKRITWNWFSRNGVEDESIHHQRKKREINFELARSYYHGVYENVRQIYNFKKIILIAWRCLRLEEIMILFILINYSCLNKVYLKQMIFLFLKKIRQTIYIGIKFINKHKKRNFGKAINEV